MQLPMLPPGHHIPPETIVNHEQFQQPMYNYPMRAPIPPQYGPPPNYINPSFNPHFIHPEYRIYELNKRLQQRTEDSDNLWWEAFVTEFFEDDAKLTMSFCLEDGPKRYCINRTLVPRFFRSIFEGGAVDLYFMLRYWKEIYHGPAPPPTPLGPPTSNTGPVESNTVGPGGRAGMGKHPLFLTMDCEHASMVTILDKPMFTKIVSEGRLLLDFLVFDDVIRIKRWHFIIRHHTELIPRNVLAMQDPSILEQLSKNVTRSGLTNTTLNYLRLCVILEPMAELMSRHKAYALTPRDCMKTTLFQKWQKIMGNNDHHPPPPHHPHHHPHPHGNGPAPFGMMTPQGRYPQGLGPAPLLNGRPGSNASQAGGGMPHPSGIPTPTSIPTPTTLSAPPKPTKTRRKRKSDNNAAGGPAMQSPGKKRGSLAASASLSSSSLNSLGNMVLNNHQQQQQQLLQQQQLPLQPHNAMQGQGMPFNPSAQGVFGHPGAPNHPTMFSLASQDVMIVGEPTLMGGEFGDEDERLIARLENIQYGDGSGPPMITGNQLQQQQQQHYSNSNQGAGGQGPGGANVFVDQQMMQGNNNLMNNNGGGGVNPMMDLRNQFHPSRQLPSNLGHHNSFRNVQGPPLGVQGPGGGAEEDLLPPWSAHPPPNRPDPPQEYFFDTNANSAPPSMLGPALGPGGGAGHALRRPPSLPLVFTPREGAPSLQGGGVKSDHNNGTSSLLHFGNDISPTPQASPPSNNKK